MFRNAAGGNGISTIEILTDLAMLFVVLAVLGPVVAGGKAKIQRHNCLSHQQQIVTSMLIYAQDHKGVLPAGWDDVTLAPALLRCPAAGKNVRNAYVYNATVAGHPLHQLQDTASVFLTADGEGKDNLAYAPCDLRARHQGLLGAVFADGHAEIGPTARLFECNTR